MVEDPDGDDKVRLAFALLDKGIEERREAIKRLVEEIEGLQEQRYRLVDAIRKAKRGRPRRGTGTH